MANGMNQQQVHEAIDESLKHLHGNPFLYERIRTRLEDTVPVKKKISVSLIVTVVLLFLTMSVVVAANFGVFSSFSWHGELLKSYNNAAIEEGNEGSYDFSSRQLEVKMTNMDDFHRIVGTNPDLPIPSNLPDEYVFKSGTAYYEIPEDGVITLMSGDQVPEDAKISQFLSGYSICMINWQEEASDDIYLKSPLEFYVRMSNPSDVDSSAMMIPENTTVHPVSVAGMEQALSVEYNEIPIHMLMMRCKMAESITFRQNIYKDQVEQMNYGEYLVKVTSGLLSEEELLQIQWKTGNK